MTPVTRMLYFVPVYLLRPRWQRQTVLLPVTMSPVRWPPEVWLEVFHWATYVSGDGLYTSEYLQFQTPRGYKMLDASLKVKAVVVRVCRQWRALAICVSDTCGRAGKLRGAREEVFVEPSCLTNTVTTNQHLSSTAILRHRPELEITSGEFTRNPSLWLLRRWPHIDVVKTPGVVVCQWCRTKWGN